MKYYFAIFVLLFLTVYCDIFSTPFATFVTFSDYSNNLQLYSSFYSDSTGDVVDNLQYGTGQQLFFACLSAVDTNHNTLSIVGQAPFNYSLGLSINSSVIAPNGLQFFRTATSFGFGANESLTNCSAANSSSILCFNINATTGAFGPGGYCGSEGIQQQNSVVMMIYSAPCLNSTVGDSCQIPGYNLCAQNATCMSNYLCNGTATFTEAPVPLSNSCWTPTTCDISTGTYRIQNTSSLLSCSNGHACIVGERCDGMQNCVGGYASCPNLNTCLGPIFTCDLSTNWTCVFDNQTNQGKPCNFTGGFPCRETDTCDNGACKEGDPKPLPAIDTGCTYSNLTCNNSTGNWDMWFYANGTTCQPTDQCKLAQCVSGGCSGNPINKNSTLGTISECLLAVCNSTTGQWTTIGRGNPGISCTYPNVTNPEICANSYCDAFDTCVRQSDYVCPFNPLTPCVTYQCNPNLTLSTRCEAIPLDGVPCNINSCYNDGNCSTGFCLNVTIETCPNIVVFDPQCAAPVCQNNTGCFLHTFSSNVSCEAPCYLPGTGHCLFGTCTGGIYSCSTSFAMPLRSFYPFYTYFV